MVRGLRVRSPSNQFFDDKEAVTADPVKAGTAYAVWDRLIEPTGNPRASTRTSAFTGPATFAKTTDGGRTWTTAQVIVNTGQHRQTIGNEVVVDPRTGTLYDFFDLITPPSGVTGDNLAFVSSTDGGLTRSGPDEVDRGAG